MPTHTVESCIQSFPNPNIIKKLGDLTWNKINDVHELLLANASSIYSTRGGENHGLLFIIQEPAKHLTLKGYVFMPPTNPGTVPVTLGLVRAEQVAALENTHKYNPQEHHEFKKTSKFLIQKLFSALKPQWLHHLKNPHTGFNKTTVKVYLKDLHSTCRTVTAHDLDRNTVNM